MATLQDGDFKGLDAAMVDRLYGVLECLYKPQDATTADECALTDVLRLSVFMLKSQTLQTKLKGLSILGRMMTQAIPRDVALVWKSQEALAATLTTSPFIETVFGESAHQEVIRRCKDVMRFLVEKKELTGPQVVIMWQCCIEKHEDISRSAFDLLTWLLPHFPVVVSLPSNRPAARSALPRNAQAPVEWLHRTLHPIRPAPCHPGNPAATKSFDCRSSSGPVLGPVLGPRGADLQSRAILEPSSGQQAKREAAGLGDREPLQADRKTGPSPR